MPSRLKGIETLYPISTCWFSLTFGYAFPFEGNWNTSTMYCPPFPSSFSLDMPSRLKGIETRCRRCYRADNVWLWICFPVWRELKPLCGISVPPDHRRNFGYAFPFEGNWNSSRAFMTAKATLFGYAFPFEGNWNATTSAKPLIIDWKKSDFGYAFPFEGNWNSVLNPATCVRGSYSFGYAFPFEGNWNSSPSRPFISFLLYPLDMLSRLKGIETLVATC